MELETINKAAWMRINFFFHEYFEILMTGWILLHTFERSIINAVKKGLCFPRAGNDCKIIFEYLALPVKNANSLKKRQVMSGLLTFTNKKK